MCRHRGIADNALFFRSNWAFDLFHPILCLTLVLTAL